MSRAQVWAAATIGSAAAITAAQIPTEPTVLESMWFNETFSTEGTLTLSVAPAGDDLSVIADAGGSVFGAFDPDPITVLLTDDSAGGFAGSLATPLGDAVISLAADGSFRADLTDVFGGFDPSAGSFGFDLVIFEASLSPAGFSGTYEIFESDTDTTPFAVGRIEPIPSPASWALAGLAGVMVACRRGRRWPADRG